MRGGLEAAFSTGRRAKRYYTANMRRWGRDSAMPVRIMHVVDNVGRGGMQNGLLNLIDRLDTTRFEHVICATRHVNPADGYDFHRDWVQVMCLSKTEVSARVQIGALARVIRQVRPGIVH